LSERLSNQVEPLLTVADVATWLGVEPRCVYRLASSGDLARIYVGRYLRFSAEVVQEFIDANTVEAKPAKPVRRSRPGARSRSRAHLRAVTDAE
jgi:excisionase family DNA binding protein